MVKLGKYYCLFVCILVFFSCKDKCTGEDYAYYPSGKLETIKIYNDCKDRLSYIKKTFHENGKIASVGAYKNGQKNGKFVSWYDNGQASAKWQVVEGKENGFIVCWYDNGQKQKEARLIDGLEEGEEITWYKNGDLQSKGSYKKGKKDGAWIYLDEDSGMKIRTYVNDTLNGYTYERLFDSANSEFQIITGNYRNGLENRLWKWHNADSVLTTRVNCINGINGERIDYYTNGKIKCKANLKDWLYDGLVITYDEQGNVTKRATYKEGVLLN